MPRTSKCRRVCAEPRARVFTPEPKSGGRVALSVEELEALRLCDLEGLEQDSAAKRMNVSRGHLPAHSLRRPVSHGQGPMRGGHPRDRGRPLRGGRNRLRVRLPVQEVPVLRRNTKGVVRQMSEQNCTHDCSSCGRLAPPGRRTRRIS